MMSYFKDIMESFSKFTKKKFSSETSADDHRERRSFRLDDLRKESPDKRAYLLRMNSLAEFAENIEDRKKSGVSYPMCRRLVIWGRNRGGDPSFLYLYGLQEKNGKNSDLEEDVRYHAIKISSGAGGRFPSQHRGDLFRKKGEGIDLQMDVLLPYFEPVYYHRLVESLGGYLKKKDIFFPVSDYNEVLEFSGESERYVGIVVEMIQNGRIHQRKKLLSLLWSMNPPIQVWERLVAIGSAELVGGIWMLFAQKRDDRLLDFASNFLLKEEKEEIFDRREHYQKKIVQGLSEAANRYRDVFSEEAKKKRRHSAEDYVRSILEEMNKKEDRSWKVDITEFKHRLSDIELFGFSDLLGKLAFLVDTKKLNFTSESGAGGEGAFLYFHRRIRRTADAYRDHAEAEYVIFLYHMMSAYTDPVSRGEWVPVFLKKYLYTDYFAPDIRSQTDWYRKKTRVSSEILMMQRNRLEEKKELWEEQLPLLIDLLISCREKLILRFVEKVLFSYQRKDDFVASLPFEKVLALSEIEYEPIASWFAEELDKRSLEPVQLLCLLFAPNSKKYESLIEKKLVSFEETDLLECIEGIYDNVFGIWHSKDPLNDASKKLLDRLADTMQSFSPASLQRILKGIGSFDSKFLTQELHPALKEFTERAVFSLTREAIEEAADFALIRQIFPKGHRAELLIRVIRERTTPSISFLKEILEQGPPEMMEKLTEVLYERSVEWKKNPQIFLLLAESSVRSWEEIVSKWIREMNGKEREEAIKLLLDSPSERAYMKAFEFLEKEESLSDSEDFLLRMLEHGSEKIRSYAAKRMRGLIASMREKRELKEEQAKILLYYMKSLLLLPNRVSESKAEIYNCLPDFLKLYPKAKKRVEEMLLDIGGSNIKRDSERALVALARIRKEGSA